MRDQRVRWTIQLIVGWALGTCLGLGAAPGVAGAQEPPVVPSPPATEPFEGLPVRRIEFVGLKRVQQSLVENNIRTAVGEPYLAATIEQDVRNLTRLNQFRIILPRTELAPDGSGVVVIFQFDEWPLAEDVQVTGNVTIKDQDIFDAVLIRPGDPLDSFQINRARELIVELYQKRGFYLAQVEVDSNVLTESNIILFRVREGPRVKIKAIEFRGNEAIGGEQLQTNLKTKTAIFLLRTGQLDEEALAADIAKLVEYYKDRGYLDVRIERQLDLSNDLKEAKVVFLIEEGRLFTMRSVRVEGATRLLEPQVAALVEIKSGDVYSKDKIEKSRTILTEALGRLGYVDVSVETRATRDSTDPFVDLLIILREGDLAFTGEVIVKGNALTRSDVILREIDFRPNRPLSSVAIANAERDIRATGLFDTVSITPAEPDPADPRSRDVVVEVKEGDTGSINFGAAVSSDLGLFGSIGLTQRNFDIADFPESFEEFARGRAFRGAGQVFNINLQPGNEFTNLSMSLSEPYLLGTDNALSSSVAYTIREQDAFDEERWGGVLRLSRRLGEVWTGYVSTRFQSIDLSDIERSAPVDVFNVEDEHIVTGLGAGIIRTTVDNRLRPTRGSRIELGVEQIGALGGDFDFTRLTAEHTVFLALSEDFLGRKSVLSLSTRVGYQFAGNSPIYERFFLGGRSFRGFDYRTVSPRGLRPTGIPSDDPIGGDWMFFWGAEYEFPIFDRFVGGVFFVDTGTVTTDLGFDDYRVSIGGGVRLYIPQLGQAPLAFDLGFPIVKQDTDDRQIFSFSIDVPF